MLSVLTIAIAVVTTQALAFPVSGDQASPESSPLRPTDPLRLQTLLQTQASEALQLLRNLRPLIQQELTNWTQSVGTADPEALITEYIRGAEKRMAVAEVLKACVKLRAVLSTGTANGREVSRLLVKLRKRLMYLREKLLEAELRDQVPPEFNQLLLELGLSALDRDEVIETLIEVVAEQAQPSVQKYADHKQEIISFPITV
uniref:Uncharacterized protein n=1 Tax=Schistocephalus solidus TaxID=70667 RepID=A0A0X3NQJ9_SCHSO